MEEIREPSAAAAPQAPSDVITETDAPFASPADNGEVIRVRYNHEDRQLSREEAAVYAQKGLKFDALAGQLGEDTLRRLPGLAARLRELDGTGRHTLPELIDALIYEYQAIQSRYRYYQRKARAQGLRAIL